MTNTSLYAGLASVSGLKPDSQCHHVANDRANKCPTFQVYHCHPPTPHMLTDPFLFQLAGYHAKRGRKDAVNKQLHTHRISQI